MPCSCMPRFVVTVREYITDPDDASDVEPPWETHDATCLCGAVRALEGNPLPSVWPVDPARMHGREWVSTEPQQQTDGTYFHRTVHVGRLDREITGPLLAKLWRLAGIPHA